MLESAAVYAAQEKENMCQAEIILDGMGVTDGSLGADKLLTRAEFTGLAVRALKSGIAAADFPYTDVSADNPYISEIAAAYSLGALSAADKFCPDDKITYEQAAKILICFLGYDYSAQPGGFPSGYVSCAQTLGLFDGLTYRIGAAVSGAEGATMIRNAMESYYIKTSADGKSFEKSDNRYMNEYLDIYKEKGVVTSDGIIDLDGAGTPGDEIKIDGESFLPGKSNIGEYLGEEVIFYYRLPDDDQIGEVLYAESAGMNKVYSVSSDDILPSTTVKQFVYEEKGKTKTMSIASDVKVVYNGKAEFSYTKDMLMPKEGCVKLIDSNSDKAADVIISYDYSIGVVNNYNSALESIVLKYSQKSVSLDDYDDVYIRKGGVKISASELSEWDVLNICENGKFIMIDVSAQPVSGTIKSVSLSDDDKTITIDNSPVKVSENYIAQSGELKAGEKGIFHTNIFGKIVCADYGTTSRRNYSVILKAFMDDDLDSTAKFKLFKKDNTSEVARGAKLIKCDGVWKKAEEAVKYVNNAGLYQVVVTDSNSNGEINSIDFALDMTNVSDYRGYDDDNFTLDVNIEGGDGVRFYNNTGAGCHIQSGVVFFSIPQDKTNTDLYKAEGYKRVYDMDTTIKNIKYYDLDRFNRPGCVVISDYDLETPPGQENVDLQDDWYVVSDIKVTLDGEGAARTKLCGYHRDKYQEYYISDEGAHNVSNFFLPNGERMSNPIPNNDRTMWGFIGHNYTDISTGDIMQLGYDTDGDVSYYRMLWSSKLMGTKIHVNESGAWVADGGVTLVDPGEYYEINENPGTAANPNFMSIGYTAYGEITESLEGWVRYKTMFVKREDGGSVQRAIVQRAIMNENSVYVITLGKNGAVVTKGSASDIIPGDKCFIQARDNHCWYMAVIRGE